MDRNGPRSLPRGAAAALLSLGAAALFGCDRESVPTELRVIGGDPEAGRDAVARIACGVCHHIPGVRGAHGVVGPPLTEFGRRQFIAGVVPNRPAMLVRWVKDAPSIAPNTGMPGLPLTEEEARHVAAYLYTLR
jgi:cytochrome c